ncbi:hypothetical protein C4568_03755 [Candidatus Parcubacteria bacterium]|nr:MAG: hypothetical protein C4568_03755 [Candidatus Parcubacteria bacterium]
MAKKEKDVVEEAPVVLEAPDLPLEEVDVVSAPAGDRKARWEKFLADAEKQNPVKFAVKKANGEFDEIPESFR